MWCNPPVGWQIFGLWWLKACLCIGGPKWNSITPLYPMLEPPCGKFALPLISLPRTYKHTEYGNSGRIILFFPALWTFQYTKTTIPRQTCFREYARNLRNWLTTNCGKWRWWSSPYTRWPTSAGAIQLLEWFYHCFRLLNFVTTDPPRCYEISVALISFSPSLAILRHQWASGLFPFALPLSRYPPWRVLWASS